MHNLNHQQFENHLHHLDHYHLYHLVLLDHHLHLLEENLSDHHRLLHLQQDILVVLLVHFLCSMVQDHRCTHANSDRVD